MFTGKEISLGRVFGIEITLDYSWFWIFLLVTWSFAAGLFPFLAPGRPALTYWFVAILATLLFFGSVVVHELSHTLVARANNLPIGKITLFVFGGVSRLSEEPDSPGTEIKMALAGPLASLVAGTVFLSLGFLLSRAGFNSLLMVLFRAVGSINLALAFFNLLPGFPLDGGRVLRGLVWYSTGDLLRSTRVASIAGRVVAWGIIIFGLFQFLTLGFLSGIWLMLIGFFLRQAAIASYEQTVIYLGLRRVPVSRIAHDFRPSERKDKTAPETARPPGDLPRVSVHDPATKVLSVLAENNTEAAVVTEKGRETGLITLTDIKNYLDTHAGDKIRTDQDNRNK
ncbi:MAG: site-2 protease family protein [Patescibacteria group bacterium]